MDFAGEENPLIVEVRVHRIHEKCICIPVVWVQDCFARCDQTGFGVSGRVKNLAGIFIGRGQDDKTEEVERDFIRRIDKTYMWKTLRALRAPEFHWLIYPSRVGLRLSANFPMIGSVHFEPGSPAFFFL